MCVCMYVCICVCVYKCVGVYIYRSIYICILCRCRCRCRCRRIFKHTHTRAYLHICLLSLFKAEATVLLSTRCSVEDPLPSLPRLTLCSPPALHGCMEQLIPGGGFSNVAVLRFCFGLYSPAARVATARS